MFDEGFLQHKSVHKSTDYTDRTSPKDRTTKKIIKSTDKHMASCQDGADGPD